ncbi:MAG: S41 family peptidase [Patescibacteria group bacterium]
MKKYISVPIWLIVLLAIFGIGFFIGQETKPSIEKIERLTNKEIGQPIDVDFSLFWDAWRLIEKKYVDREELNYQDMVYGAIEGLVNSLGDPYSVFMKPVDSERFLQDIKGSFSGIGAEVGIRQRILTIISPLKDSPAEKARLKAGDKILKVDETLTADLTLDEAVNMIRGEKGTEVKLLISREEWDEAKEITVVRATIQIPIIDWEIKDDNIAYVQFHHFTENSSGQFEKIIKEITRNNPRGLILDLRNNPGGYLEVAVDITSWFLPKRELVVVEDYGNGQNIEHRSKGYKGIENLPVIVLINEGSASASEILAGALRDIRGIKIVGQSSFGKGSVQQLEEMKDDSSIKITVAKWLTPSGTSINDEGIKPDYEVELTQEDFDELRDPQLDKALEIINE